MDYKTLAEAANSSESIYNAVTLAAAFTGVVAGYVIGALKLSGRRVRIAEAESAARVEEANARQAEAALKIEELKDADGAQKRRLELMERKRAYELEDEGTNKKEAKEEAAARGQQGQVRHQRRMELAGKLTALEPGLKAYLDRRTAAEQGDAAMEAEKAAFKNNLYQKMLKLIDENEEDDGGVAGRITNDSIIISDDDEEAVNRIAELLYPSSSRKSATERIPPQFRGLIKLVLGEEALGEKEVDE